MIVVQELRTGLCLVTPDIGSRVASVQYKMKLIMTSLPHTEREL